MFTRLSDSLYVSAQITADDVTRAQAQGIVMIVNNRPEDESADQTPGDVIAQAAHHAGIAYVAIPVTHAGFSAWQVEAMTGALATASGPVLAYCRSGTRSTLLWALAEAGRGGDPLQIADTAAAAGYDISPVQPLMDMLLAKHRDPTAEQ